MNKTKITLSIMIFLFCVILIAPISMVNLEQNKISVYENRVLENFPSMIDTQGHVHASEIFKFETWLNDNIGFRSLSSRIAAWVDLKIFHTSPTSSVRVGRDGWYYYTPGYNLQIALGDFPLNESTLSGIATAQQGIKTALDGMGIRYLLVLTPGKPSIYPEFISRSNIPIRETPVDIISAYLANHTDVPVANVKDALLAEKEKGSQVFYKSDTHWSPYGAYVGFQSISDSITSLYGKQFTSFQIKKTQMPFQGDLYGMMNAKGLLKDETIETCEIVQPQAKKTDDPELLSKIEEYQNKPGSNWQGAAEIYENPGKEGTVLIFGDSYFQPSLKMVEYFAESYQKTILVRCLVAYQETIELIQPDLVVMEITERAINMLNGSIIQQGQ